MFFLFFWCYLLQKEARLFFEVAQHYWQWSGVDNLWGSRRCIEFLNLNFFFHGYVVTGEKMKVFSMVCQNSVVSFLLFVIFLGLEERNWLFFYYKNKNRLVHYFSQLTVQRPRVELVTQLFQLLFFKGMFTLIKKIKTRGKK